MDDLRPSQPFWKRATGMWTGNHLGVAECVVPATPWDLSGGDIGDLELAGPRSAGVWSLQMEENNWKYGELFQGGLGLREEPSPLS